VGIIAPWNYPLTLTLSDALPALVAGNTVVVKPDAQTPLSALLGEQIIQAAGIPPNVFQVLPGTGAVVGAVITESADYVMFTGSTATGQQLAERTGRRLVGFSGELGGKNPMIVAQDANIRDAVTGAITGCFSNSGQLCVSIERILVDKAIATRFTNHLVNRVEKLNIGTGGWAEDMGSLISPAHVTHVCQLVDDALSRGATLLTGGPRPDLGPSFLAPVLLANVPPEAKLYREEVFGPVAYIEIVNSETEAIAKANDSNYGLAASIFAKPATARRIARQLHAGSVNINEGFAATFGSVAAPMGGMKHSGMGRRHGVTGLLKYTEPKTIAEQRIMPIAGPRLLPRRLYAATMTKVLRIGKHFL
jgi:succinic semialdehyde dehydrogenase